MKTVLIIEGSLGSCLLERKDSVLRHRLNKSLFSKMKQILQREIGVVCLQVKHHNEFHVENFKESLINMCEAGYKFVGKGSPPPTSISYWNFPRRSFQRLDLLSTIL